MCGVPSLLYVLVSSLVLVLVGCVGGVVADGIANVCMVVCR